MIRQQNIDENFHPTIYKDHFLMDIFSGKTREPSSLARVTFGEQAIQLRLEAGFIVTLPFHKDVHF